MRNVKNEIDIDYIGGQETLTKAEESALSAYFKQKKEKPETKNLIKRKSIVKRKLETN